VPAAAVGVPAEVVARAEVAGDEPLPPSTRNFR